MVAAQSVILWKINVKINHNRFPFFVFVCICADNNCHSRRKIRILQNRNHTTMATTIKKDIYETSLGEVAYFTICDDECGSVVLSALGAGVVALSVPDGNGEYRDVVTGYQSAETYCHDDPNAGKFIGRYANRIARGVFSIDGNEYHLECNCGPNALHGGREGFAHRIWKSRTVGDNAVEFSLTSDDGDQGYPGTLTVKALYTWMPSCGLCLNIVATTDRPTVLNLTNHCYFNLDGHNSGCVLNHNLQLNASRYLVTDSSLAPTGELADVKGTPMDFLQKKTLGRDINADFQPLAYGKGYDHCWAVDGWQPGKLSTVARLESPLAHGRVLEVESTLPAVQVYTANWLTCSSPEGKDGAAYRDYDAVAIECQGFPDAPNHPEFPSQRLNPGEEYRQTIRYIFKSKDLEK